MLVFLKHMQMLSIFCFKTQFAYIHVALELNQLTTITKFVQDLQYNYEAICVIVKVWVV